MAEEKDMERGNHQEGRVERRIAAKNEESVEARGTVRKARAIRDMERALHGFSMNRKAKRKKKKTGTFLRSLWSRFSPTALSLSLSLSQFICLSVSTRDINRGT